jgi:hypothetical protein
MMNFFGVLRIRIPMNPAIIPPSGVVLSTRPARGTPTLNGKKADKYEEISNSFKH